MPFRGAEAAIFVRCSTSNTKPRDGVFRPGNELLRGEPATVARPHEGGRLDLQRAAHGLAVEYQLAEPRASHPHLLRPPDPGA